MKEDTKAAIFAYNRKLRLVAFDLEHGPSLCSIDAGPATSFLLDNINTLIIEGQEIERLVARETSHWPPNKELPPHQPSALTDEALPQVFYCAAKMLSEATTAHFTVDAQHVVVSAISGIRNVAEDIFSILQGELTEEIRSADSTYEIGVS